MAPTKRKRRRKHRGTQSGRVDTRPKGRPRNRAEAKQRAKSRGSRSKGKGRGRDQQMPLRPPSWRSAALKAIPIAGLFLALIVFAFGEKVSAALPLAAFMLLFYIPMAYYTDRFFYQRQLRKQARARAEQGKGDGS